MDTQKLREELIRDEGLELVAYKDTLGYWTIGVGHLLGKDARMTNISKAEAMALLDADITEATAVARKYAPELFSKLDGSFFIGEKYSWDVRARALVNMAFNLGDKLGQFKTFLGCIAKDDWDGAGAAMMKSLWAKQVGQRAVRLRQMIVNGEAT